MTSKSDLEAYAEQLVREEACLPSFLENADEEIAHHKLQSSKALKQLTDQFGQFLSYCEDILALQENYSRYPSEYSHCEALMKKLKKECDMDDKKICKSDQNIRDLEIDVNILREQNDKLQDEVLQFSEAKEKLATEEEQLLKQRAEANESMELMWHSYVSAKRVYKTSLCCRIRLHDHEGDTLDSNPVETLTFYFLVDDASILEIKLNREKNKWKMLDAQPLIPAAVESQAFLHKTNDIRAFLYNLRSKILKWRNLS